MRSFGRRFRRHTQLTVVDLVAEEQDDDGEVVVVTMSDPVTGVANRRAAEAWLAAQGRQHRGLALVVLRVDAVDRVRRQLGDAAANRVLRHCADRLRKYCTPSDLVARGSGAEFIVVLADVDEGAAAQRSAMVRGALAPDGTTEMVITPSTTVCWLPPKLPPPADWIECALAAVTYPKAARVTELTAS